MTSQYRCDGNCTFFTSKVDDAGKIYLYCDKAKCNIHYSWRMMSSFNGCASHSDFQNDRERVLDIFLAEMRAEMQSLFEYIDWDSVEAVYIRLRSKGGE